MNQLLKITLLITLSLTILTACGSNEPENNASAVVVRFDEPKDGATVTSPFNVKMNAINYKIEPAGDIVEGSGHFHIMVDAECVGIGTVIPSDDQHKHYGKAQLETELELPPGKHTLCLQVGDGAHTATELTDVISIVVEE